MPKALHKVFGYDSRQKNCRHHQSATRLCSYRKQRDQIWEVLSFTAQLILSFHHASVAPSRNENGTGIEFDRFWLWVQAAMYRRK